MSFGAFLEMDQIGPKNAILGVQNGVLGPCKKAFWRTSKGRRTASARSVFGGSMLDTSGPLQEFGEVDVPEPLWRG